MKLPLFAKKPKLIGDPLDYLDYDFYQVVLDNKKNRHIVDMGYVYEISPGMYGCVQYSGLWLDPKKIRSEGWDYYEDIQATMYREIKDLDGAQASRIIEQLAPGAVYKSMKDVDKDTPPGLYYMYVRDMRDAAFSEAAAEYDYYGYSEEVSEDTLAYLDDVRMDEVSDSHAYHMNGKLANKLMHEAMWEEQKTYNMDRKGGLLNRMRLFRKP